MRLAFVLLDFEHVGIRRVKRTTRLVEQHGGHHALQQQGWGCSSVGTASDRHADDTGSIPRCSKGFFFPRVNFQCRLSYGVHTPPCAIACINSRVHFEDPVVHVKSSVDYGNTKTPSSQRRLGSATLSQLAFPEESNPNFPWEKSE